MSTPLLTRKRIILAKIEGTYGTDPTPTGASNAILVRNLSVTPMESDFADRDLIRPYLGRSEQLPAGIRMMAEFECELAGSGTAGTAPAWGPLLRACAFAQTLTAAAVTGTAQSGSTSTTIKLASGASASDGAYVGMPITTTGGTGDGQSGTIIGYNGTTKVATVAKTWAVTPDNTTTYSIGANAVYKPVSSSFESVTIYAHVDGLLHKGTGCRGTVSIGMSLKQIPVLKFNLTGIFNSVTDTALPTPTYTAFQNPLPVTNTNTGSFSLHDVAAVMSEFTCDAANSVVHRTLVGGAESVLVTDRQAAGTISIEADLVANADWWTKAQAATLGALTLTHGTTGGNKITISSPRVQLTKPSYTDMDGVQMVQMGVNFVPTSGGGDEIAIAAF